MKRRDSATINPHSDAGGCAPSPRKLRVAKSITAKATRTVSSTMMGEMTLGSKPNCTERLCSLTTGAMGRFKGVTEMGSADSHYYNWVDQFDTFGLGRNTPIATGNGSDALLALNQTTGQFTVLRVPYPSGFFAKGMDGRIDDPRTGWKGKGLWSTWATRTPFHTEGEKMNQSKVVKFQLRPNALAR